MPPTHITRRVLMLAGYLFAGVVTTVSVAWSFTLWHRVSSRYDWDGGSNRSGEEWSITGAQFFWIREPRAALACFDPRTERTPWTAAWLKAALISSSADSVEADAERVYDARGWPMLSLWCQYGPGFDLANKRFPVHGAIEAPLKDRGRGDFWIATPVGLPVRPIWPGLLIDSLLFAACFWSVPTAIRAARCHVRRHANRCPRCAYDLLGLAPTAPCPECGIQ